MKIARSKQVSSGRGGAALVAAALAGGATVAVAGFLLARRRERIAERAFQHRLTVATEPQPFDPGRLDDLPAPARRYLLHALPMGTPTRPCTSLRMTGRIKPNPRSRWLPFKATEIINPARGFAWEGTVGLGPVSLHITDTYARGEGHTNLWLGGLIPLRHAGGPDLSESAYGRLVAEAIFAPAALLPPNRIRWRPIDDTSATYTIALDGYKAPVTITVDDDGALRSVSVQRHGKLNGPHSWGPVGFGADILEEATFDGLTLPSRIRAGWGYGTESFVPTFEATVTSAVQPG